MLISFAPFSGDPATVDTQSPQLIIHAPPLGDAHTERLADRCLPSGNFGRFQTFNCEPLTAGFGSVSLSGTSIREEAGRIYRDIFASLKGSHLYRIWNYVPKINEGGGDDENYRQFCLGRSEAFEDEFGSFVTASMPAGSCVGSDGDQLVVIAIAGDAPPDHHENPKQIPAYQYPREYGPRSPSFARASSVKIGDHRYRFISGTAAVLGHESVGFNDLDRQLQVTCDNIETILEETLEPNDANPGPKSAKPPTGKVYLRHGEHYAATKSYLEKRFPRWCQNLIYLRADICRKELLLEVEFNFVDQL